MWAGVLEGGGEGGSEGGGRKDGRGGEGEGGKGAGGADVDGYAMTKAGTGDDGRLGGDWLRRLRLRLWCGWGDGPWRGPGVTQRETVGCAASPVCVWGKWAGDAGVGSARADGSGGWKGDEVW